MSSAVSFIYDDQRWHPPAPALAVELSGHADEEHSAFVALLDTGADFTVIPDRLVEELGLVPVNYIDYATFVAGKKVGASAPVYVLHVEVTGAPIQGYIEVARHEFAAGQRYIILGRDFLNLFVCRFDGPHLRGELAAP